VISFILAGIFRRFRAV